MALQDPCFDKVKLLLHGEGENNSTTITDSSGGGRTVTAYGNAKISTAQARAGGASISFDGTNSYLLVDNANVVSTDFINSGTDNTYESWTCECWVYRTAAALGTLLSLRDVATNVGWSLAITATGYCALTVQGGTYTDTVQNVALNTWTHICVERAPYPSYTLTAQVNGLYAVSNNNAAMRPTTAGFRIGAKSNGTEFFAGYIDEFRFTRGVNRYPMAGFYCPSEVPFPDARSDPSFPLLLGADVTGTFSTGATSATTKGTEPLQAGVAYFGTGRISGVVKNKGTPDAPVYRRVRLFEERTGVLVRETWSNATTGAYTFDNLDRSCTYTVTSYDHTENFRAVVADRITPELMT